MSKVMRGVYRGLLSFATRTVFLAALLLPLSYSARPEPSGAPRAPEVRLALDPDWAARVDVMIDRGDHEELRLHDARAVPVLIDRLLQEGRGDHATRDLERISPPALRAPARPPGPLVPGKPPEDGGPLVTCGES